MGEPPDLAAAVDRIIEIARRLYERGYVVATDGNVSARLADGSVLITSSGGSLGDLAPSDLVRVDADGRPFPTPPGAQPKPPSSELDLHLTCYRLRPDIGAVVHAHPAACVALSVAGADLGRDILPETVIGLGRIAVAPYATPTTPEVGLSVRPFLPTADAIILARHGSVTVGKDLVAAFRALERMEHAALILYMASQLGPLDALAPEQVRRLEDARERYLARIRAPSAGAPPDPSADRPAPPPRELSPFPPSFRGYGR